MRRLALFLAFVGIAFSCSVIPARAQTNLTITFVDTGDAVTVTGLPGGTITCGTANVNEMCTIPLPTPAGAHATVGTTLPLFFHLAEPGTSGILCGDGNLGPCVSDGLHLVLGPNGSTATLIFQSDPPGALEPVGLPACIVSALVGGCQLTEDGTAQTVGIIKWSDGSVYTIKIESDALESPEPGSLILLGSGLVIAGGFFRRRWRLGTPSA
jgi:hypothetical protein